MASLVTVCVFLSLSLFCCGQENLPQCASLNEAIQSKAGKQLQVQYVYYSPGGHCTDMTCLKEPGHVNDSCICEDGRNNKCYPRLLSSAVDDMYDNCDDKTCNVWQVFTSNVRPHVSICVVYMYTDVSEAVDPCQELKSRRFRSPVSLVPSRDDTTCHSLCSISSVDKPQDRNSSVKIEWNFVDKSDRNQVEYRVMNNITRDSKPWTSMSKYYHRKKEFSLTNRNLEIRFNLTDMTSIRRLRISVEYDADIMVSCNTSVPDITPTLNTSIPRENKTFPVMYVVGAVVAVAAITLSSALIIVLYRRHRRLRATLRPSVTSLTNSQQAAGMHQVHLRAQQCKQVEVSMLRWKVNKITNSTSGS
ncbi:uncharacterized protein LOC112566868 [Pomacea canaliculata]|uniref:uncharacterized protein LOC112566868 n=1 Tax=Pomacea canaliculata TaxID=400727 RepID=UPI000D736705|nr:uncharacterized protein LOC112566868 [Pomacea canaliculata]